MRRFWFILLCALAACDSSSRLGPEGEPSASLPLDMPSADESVFAECRDFTVVGYFDPPLSRPGNVRVELFAGERAHGVPLRVVRSHVDPATGVTPRAALDFSYAKGQAWGPEGAVTDSELMVMTPDLVAVPGGLLDPGNKAVVTHEYYAAVILGGVTKDFDTSYAGEDGMPWRDLTAGVYTLRVVGESGELEGLSASRQLRFGRTDAMLGRFNPPEHKERLLAEATAAGRRTYIDFFPGFFSHEGYSHEIAERWMPNNSVEVVNDCPASLVDGVASARNDVLLYNISSGSATNLIEIGSIAAHELIDSDRTTFHYYSLGEPSLQYVDRETRRPVSLSSNVVSFEPLDRLVLTRAEAEFDDWAVGDNRYDVSGSRSFELFSDFSEAIRLDDDEMLSVFGVVSPLPTTTTAGGLAVQYVAEDRVRSIRYELRTRRDAVLAGEQPVGLRRRYEPARQPRAYSESVYEFVVEIRPAMEGLAAGDYELLLQCLDASGEPVVGGEERLELRVGIAR